MVDQDLVNRKEHFDDRLVFRRKGFHCIILELFKYKEMTPLGTTFKTAWKEGIEQSALLDAQSELRLRIFGGHCGEQCIEPDPEERFDIVEVTV